MPDNTTPVAATALPPFAPGSDWGARIDANPKTYAAEIAAIYGPGNFFNGKLITGYRHSRAAGLGLFYSTDSEPVMIPGTAG